MRGTRYYLAWGVAEREPLFRLCSELIVSGTMERELSDQTWNEDFVPGSDAHIVVSIRRYDGEDSDAPLVMTADFP